MKILHISNKPVYPTVDGGCVAMARLLENLSQVADSVDHICLNTSKHPFVENAYPEQVSFALEPNDCFLDTDITIFGALKALYSGKNYNLRRFYKPEIGCKLRSLIAGKNYHAIVFESIYAAVYLADLRSVSSAQMIIRMHNIEHDLWFQQAQSASFPKSKYLSSLAKSLKKEEIQLLQSADRLWPITTEDQEKLKLLNVTTPARLIRVAIPENTSTSTCSGDFFHLGSMNWEPNKTAVNRLLKSIWPQFILDNKTSQLHLAGTFFSEHQFPVTPRAIFHGKVPDSTKFMAENGTLAAPVVSGSGIRIKLLEAMAIGAPCITTQLGAAGIDPEEAGILIAESDSDWQKAMQQLSKSNELRQELGIKARSYMEKYHSFAAVNDQIHQELEF